MTEVITDEQKIDEKKIFAPEEIHEMFDSGFLTKLQVFAQRTKNDLYPDKNINSFISRMELKFTDLETPLTYKSIIQDVHLQLQPVFQEDIDKANTKSDAKTKLQKIIDEAQADYDAEIKRIDEDGESEDA